MTAATIRMTRDDKRHPMPAFDYSQIYDVYDSYVRYDGDVPFFVRASQLARGEVLELMAGTGRISQPLVNAGISLTCLEYDHGMASVLARKVPRARVVCADVLAMPFRRRFHTILLPFQGLSELATREERARLMHEAAALLEEGKTFFCTAHNPRVRARTLDGSWQNVGTFGNVEVRIRGTVSGDLVEGEQHIVVRGDGGAIERDHHLPLRFSLPPFEEIKALGEDAGLRLQFVAGDYHGSLYEETTSPVIVAMFTPATRQ